MTQDPLSKQQISRHLALTGNCVQLATDPGKSNQVRGSVCRNDIFNLHPLSFSKQRLFFEADLRIL